MTRDELLQQLRDAAHASETGPWRLGDLLNVAERVLPDYDDVLSDVFGRFHLSTLNTYKRVAAAFPPEARVPGLSFSSHRAVAALAPGERDEILTQAAEEGWGSREVKEEVKALKPARQLPPWSLSDWMEKCEAFQQQTLERLEPQFRETAARVLSGFAEELFDVEPECEEVG